MLSSSWSLALLEPSVLGSSCCQCIPLEHLWSSVRIRTWLCKKLWCSCSFYLSGDLNHLFCLIVMNFPSEKKIQDLETGDCWGDVLAFPTGQLIELCMLLMWRWVISKISVLIHLVLIECSSARNGHTPEMAMLSLGLLQSLSFCRHLVQCGKAQHCLHGSSSTTWIKEHHSVTLSIGSYLRSELFLRQKYTSLDGATKLWMIGRIKENKKGPSPSLLSVCSAGQQHMLKTLRVRGGLAASGVQQLCWSRA